MTIPRGRRHKALRAALLASAFTLPQGVAGASAQTLDITFSGSTVGQPSFDRPWGGYPPPLLSGIITPFSVLPFRVTGSGTLTQRWSGSDYDSYAHLYRVSFDPNSPLTNVLAGDDDGAGYPNPFISHHLDAGTDYFTVTSAYAGSAGTYAVNFRSGAIQGLVIGADLSVANSYTGPTVLNAGRLEIAAGGVFVSDITVNGGGLVVNGVARGVNLASGRLSGTGTMGATTIGTGATLAPGNSIGTVTVNGQMTFAPGSFYEVEVSPAGADRTNVTATGGPGSADLSGGTVKATYLPGNHVAKKHVIVNAAGGLGGTSFAGLEGSTPKGFTHALEYDGTTASLVLAMTPAQGNTNQQSVWNALSQQFDAAGSLPGEFTGMGEAEMTVLSGEVGAGAQQVGTNANVQFLNVITGPLTDGAGLGGAPLAYAGERARDTAGAGRLARLAARGNARSHAAQQLADSGGASENLRHRFEVGFPETTTPSPERFALWGQVMGGGGTLDGDAATGTQRVVSGSYGLASGMDWRTNQTQAGIALGASWSQTTTENLGATTIGSAFAGVRGVHDFGTMYVSGAAAYGAHFAQTRRDVFGETYSAGFTAHSLSARLETGARFKMSASELAPYAALQATTLWTPAYAETGSGAGTFALAYNAASNTDLRSEIGLRVSRAFHGETSTTTLSGGLGWAHSFNPRREVTAGFVALPGSQFVTRSAAAPSDTALVSVGVEHRMAKKTTVSATASGEFGRGLTAGTVKASLKLGW